MALSYNFKMNSKFLVYGVLVISKTDQCSYFNSRVGIANIVLYVQMHYYDPADSDTDFVPSVCELCSM